MTARLPHRRGIDGLRAFAVAAVLLYHADVTWLPGGFLGVDVFFAISGYLITSLLVAELAQTGRVSLRAFWVRRARRLLPAVIALLVGVTLLALLHAEDAGARLRGDVAAALTYVSNWWQIVRGETYFESFGRPPLLRHLWSLAVEEQLYVLVPAALAWFGRRGTLRRDRLALGALGLAAASSILLARLWETDDPTRAWFGTDTRSTALLVGVALALVLPLGRHVPAVRGAARRALDAVAGGVLVGLTALMLLLDDRSPVLPHGGFAATAVLSGVAVVVASHPSSRVGRVLGCPPLVWLGTRSYAIYLWHWPIFALTRPGLDVQLDGWRLLWFRLLLTAVAAEVSWRLVEQPWRTGAVARAWRDLRREVRIRVAVVGTSAATVLSIALAAGLMSATTTTPDLLATVAISPTTASTLAVIPTTTTSTTTTTVAPPTTVAAAPPTTQPPPPPGPVLAVGDSVLLAAQGALREAVGDRLYVDAAIGRQVQDGLEVLQHYRDTGTFAQLSALVIHLGTNGLMTGVQFERLAAIVEGVPRVVVLTVRVPKPWEAESNASIVNGAPRYPAMRVADWHVESGQPGALAEDGVHPSIPGARIYSYIVMRQL